MNTSNWSCLTWGKLMNPSMIGKDILIIYWGNGTEDPPMKIVKIVGPDYIENEHVLIVEDPSEDDIFIITREGKSRTWESYLVLEGF